MTTFNIVDETKPEQKVGSLSVGTYFTCENRSGLFVMCVVGEVISKAFDLKTHKMCDMSSARVVGKVYKHVDLILKEK